MILDGAVDPNADQIEEEIRRPPRSRSVRQLAADCASSLTARGHDPAKAVDIYKSLVEPVGRASCEDEGSRA